MPISALVEVKDGAGSFGATTNGVDVTPNNTISIRLTNTTGITQWFLEVLGTDELSSSPTLVGVNSLTHEVATPSTVVTFTMPNSIGRTLRFKSTATDGSTVDLSLFGIYTLTSLGNRAGALGETLEGSAASGWATKVNPLIRDALLVDSSVALTNQVAVFDASVPSWTARPVQYVPVSGVVGDGIADDTAAIQAAIDSAYALSGPDYTTVVYLPAGDYKTTDTLLMQQDLGAYNINFAGIELVGDRNTFPGQLGAGRLTKLIPTFTDKPVIAVQGARGVAIRRLSFQGLATLTFTSDYDQMINDDFWLGSPPHGCRTNRFSPYCAIAVDPFIAGNPGGDPGNRYPGLEAHYAGTPRASSHIVIEECSMDSFVAGIILTPSGLDANDDNIKIDRCTFSYGLVGLALCQSQERGVVVTNSSFGGCRIAISTRWCPTSNSASPRVIGCIFGLCRYLFDFSMAQDAYISGCYAESTLSIGRFGAGFNSGNSPATIEACTFTLWNPDFYGDHVAIDSHLFTACPTKFVGCHLGLQGGSTPFAPSVFNVVNYTEEVTFDNCLLSTETTNDVTGEWQWAFFREHHVNFIDCKIRDVEMDQAYNRMSSLTYHDSTEDLFDRGRVFGGIAFDSNPNDVRYPNPRWQTIYLGYGTVTATIDEGIAEFTASDETIIKVGDPVYRTDPLNPIEIDPQVAEVALGTFMGVVKTIVGDLVTLKNVPKGVWEDILPVGPTLLLTKRIGRYHLPSTGTVIGGGSDQVTGVKNVSTWAEGDRIRWAGSTPGIYVTAVVGDDLTLSQEVTTGKDDVVLYDAAMKHHAYDEASGVFRPEQFGAVADGSTDDSEALQMALDAAFHVNGVVQLSKAKYRIATALNTRGGRFRIVGHGWNTNASALYDSAGTVYEGYREFQSDTTPTNHLSGTVIFADNCEAFVRNDSGGYDNHGYMVFEGFAIVGNSLKTAFAFGVNPDTGLPYVNATLVNTYRDLGVFKFGVAYDLTLQYYGSYKDITARGCKIGIRLGVQEDGANGTSGNSNYVVGADLQSCDKCIALYEGKQLHVSDVIAQGHKDLVYLQPNGNNVVTHVYVHHVYSETTENPNHVFVFDDSLAVSVIKTASFITIEDVSTVGSNQVVYDFGTGGAGWSALYFLTLIDVFAQNDVVSVPSHIVGASIRGGRYLTLTTSSATLAQVDWVFVTNGGHQEGFGVPVATRIPSVVGRMRVNPDDATTSYFFTVDPANSWVGVGGTALTQLGSELVRLSHSGLPLIAHREDSSTATVLETVQVRRTTSGTQAAGLGARQAFYLEIADGSVIEAARFDAVTTNTTGATDLVFSTYSTTYGAMLERLRVTSGGVRVVLANSAANYFETLQSNTGVLRFDQAGTLTTFKLGSADDALRLNLSTGTLGLGYINNKGTTEIADARLELQDHSGYAGSGMRVKTGAIKTTDANQTTNSTLTVTLADNYVYKFTVRGTARDHAGTERLMADLTGLFYRQAAGTATQEGADVVSLIKTGGFGATPVVFTRSGNDVRVSVTGVAVTTISWRFTIIWEPISTDT